MDHSDVTATDAALALPLPAVVVAGGTVVSANDGARRLAPEGQPASLLEWFDPDSRDQVQAALVRGTRRRTVIAALLDGETHVGVHAAGVDGDRPQVVLLRPATDEAIVRAALDEVADSTFILDRHGGNRWRSERLRQRSGTTDEQARETPAGERIHPEDLPLVFETFAKVTEDRPLAVITRSRAVDDDDRWEWIEMTVWNRIAHRILQGFLVQVHNLDDGRTVKTLLSEADPDLMSLTEAAPVGIVVTDPAGHIVYRNPAARSLLGPDISSFGQQDWLELALPEHREELAEAMQLALRHDGDTTVTAAFAGDADGAPRWLRLRVTSQHSDAERPTGVIATIEDVSEQVEARAELKAAEEHMRHLATHDILTGLPNRAALTAELERAVDRHERSDRGLAVLFCDLNGFKPVNDRHGHAGGDAALVEVARRFESVVRDADFLARLGGDEFVVICEGTGDTTAVADELAQRLHDVLARPLDLDGGAVALGVSVGAALLAPGRRAAGDELLLVADNAMYEAKASGRGVTRLRWVEAG